MRVDTFSYELPQEKIAQYPADDPERARLLVVPLDGAPKEHTIADLADLIPAGSLVVMNDTRVIPARLCGTKAETGGRVEIFLVRRIGRKSIEMAPDDVREVDVWRAMGKASKALRFGMDVRIDTLWVRLLGRADDDGLLEVALWAEQDEPVDDAIRRLGRVPLPPYIKRDAEALDATRYQTVVARVDGAVAAPTAGLHLTHALLGRLAAQGSELATVTLHVGLGTFQPVTVDDLDAHPMHTERLHVSKSTAGSIARARARGAAVVAIGTTVVRALESAADPERDGFVLPCHRETKLLIQPGYTFRVVDRLLTNFHLPKSTLLALVCAFAGTSRVLAAYDFAIRGDYRFFSYGDAMLLPREAR